MKIGIIREGKNPPDKRSPFTPEQIQSLSEKYSDQFSFYVESSPVRCFSDEEFKQKGISVVEDLSACDVLFGVKEVPVDKLIPDKTYFFFSHTIKRQSYNRGLLQAVLEKNIRLIDYEVLKDQEGNRVVAFGRWAGVVGAYNAFWTYGKKTALFDLKRAHECFDLADMKAELKKVQLPPVKIILTGAGRVGKGAKEILEAMGIKEVSKEDFLHQYFEEAVFVQLRSEDYNRRKTDGGYDREEFYSNPERYESHFLKYAEEGEMLIAAAYWDPEAPRLFKLEDINSDDFALSVIADVTCDIDGSVPTTRRASTILSPVYDIDRETGQEIEAFGKQRSISVMAIDNLPCEIPREASQDFGNQLIKWVIPALLDEPAPILEKATLARDGDLTLEFMHLRDFVYPHE
ncbi:MULTISPECIES: NAD(P)-dependent oxidoreductase [unclassified Algoriphagus]|jgi:alanine dehydrogenase|uniref:NAD(P)-dependent oxidoreductase n=3 Tax=Algoriphagus TaxID=246875 RepID=UPI000C537507|nr:MULTISPECIES: NAD(P)-dependent oxidoreductase [unclassified Algoriphagus]MAL15291.1 alanine dehydrogenase [Algoriphagus sp.]MAN87457.1 alanine dehydrogenase [Algoriphagus sp.]QYH40718.1 alanine dehydrogenase [Algoriphagus sp. NBT04N3]HAD53016.1 alanine dehydrogenase [Algoriphagus sp.]HCB47838.1 alanine dehydrogenase [Algoriphagus sp.]|tara:strand:+ start:9775 stop:10983 length:1209 start_codon:yes stop_codon:yes gene_type:complete